MDFTFHRAIDECVNAELNKHLRALGVDRILSSAGLSKASDDPSKISKIVELSKTKLSMVCCGGIRSSTIHCLLSIPNLITSFRCLVNFKGG